MFLMTFTKQRDTPLTWIAILVILGAIAAITFLSV